MSREKRSIETDVVHAGENPAGQGGAVVAPIYQTATYLYEGTTSYKDVRYLRMSNSPNHYALHEKLATLEHGEAALAFGCGMAAITSTFLSLLKQGDHLLIQDSLYGGTHTFVSHDFKDLGLSYTLVDPQSSQTWEKARKPNSRAMYVEAITNPLMEVADLEGVVEFAKRNKLVSIIDSTFATPINFNPLDLGFDLVVHSATKYLNGHTDLIAGCVVGRKSLIERIYDKVIHLGGTLDPHACYLLNRGIKTLGLRIARQNESAMRLAEFLEGHPAVAQVNYPGLKSHPQHARAKRLFRGFGGMLSFELKTDLEKTLTFLSQLKIPLDAPSLGGVETLVVRPAVTSHAGLTREERASLGISDRLVRVSVGIEHIEDLLEDFRQALTRIS